MDERVAAEGVVRGRASAGVRRSFDRVSLGNACEVSLSGPPKYMNQSLGCDARFVIVFWDWDTNAMVPTRRGLHRPPHMNEEFLHFLHKLLPKLRPIA